MVLLLQLNAELSDRFPGHERRLYVFSCLKKTCRRKEGSVRALRGVRVTEAPTIDAKPNEEPTKTASAAAPPSSTLATGLGESLFGVQPSTGAFGQGNPFSSSAGVNPFSKSSSVPANPFAKPAEATPSKPTKTEVPPVTQPTSETDSLPKTFAETLSLNNPQQSQGPPPAPEPWPPESEQPPPYPISWLAEAEYETIDPNPPPRMPSSASASGATDADPGAGGGGKEDKEVFESTMDATFQKFADRIGQNPEQCIRYEFGGQPLLYSKTDGPGALLAAAGGATEAGVGVGVRTSGGIPRCPNCGANRVFEVQLTPPAIEQLEAEEDGLDGIDWGTVIVGVCEKDCVQRGQGLGATGYLEEWAGVQWEELTASR